MKIIRFLMMGLVMVLFTYASCELEDDVDPTDPMEKFLGVWKVNETCQRMNYSVDIQPDPGNSAQVLISNFGNPGPGYSPAIGIVTSNSINVFSQIIGEDWTVSGKGTYQANGTISWEYSLIIGPNSYDCTATYSRN